MCCFSAKYATLRRNNKDWLARNHGLYVRVGRHVYPRTGDFPKKFIRRMASKSDEK